MASTIDVTNPTSGWDVYSADETAFTLYIANVAPLDISLSSTAVDENDAGAVIGVLATVDPGDTHTYSVDDGRFEVVGNQLKLKDGIALNYEATASIPIVVTSTDSEGLTFDKNFVITVNNVNDAPIVAAPLLDHTSVQGIEWVYTIPPQTFIDEDSPNLLLVVLADGGALPAWLSFDAATRTFSGTPPEDWTGEIEIKLIAYDGQFTADTVFTLFVVEPFVNQPPYFDIASDLVVTSGRTVVDGFGAIDDDGHPLIYTIVGGPDRDLFSLDRETGRLSFKDAPDYDVPASAAGTNAYKVQVSVSDGYDRVTRLFTVEVQPHDEIITVEGTAGDDVFDAAAGHSIILGGEGHDTVIFAGAGADYAFELADDGAVVVMWPDGGSTRMIGVETLTFDDMSFDLTVAAASREIEASVLDKLVEFYIAYFNRVPEAEGIVYWIEQYQNGKSLDQIAVEFYEAGVSHSAITGYSADMPLADFIGILYRNVLGRSGETAPDQSEIGYWLNEVATGQVSREGLAQRFLEDARLFYDHPEVGFVPHLLDNRLEFGKLHAITYGIDYLSPQDAIAKTVALAAAVTPQGFEDAVKLIGVGGDGDLV